MISRRTSTKPHYLTRAEIEERIERLSRNKAEVIHDLYRFGAAPRSPERLIDLVQEQVKRIMRQCLWARDEAA